MTPSDVVRLCNCKYWERNEVLNIAVYLFKCLSLFYPRDCAAKRYIHSVPSFPQLKHIKLSFYIHMIMYQFPHTISKGVVPLFIFSIYLHSLN